jgi:hypothetical protein
MAEKCPKIARGVEAGWSVPEELGTLLITLRSELALQFC